jgi:hypothetical protein
MRLFGIPVEADEYYSDFFVQFQRKYPKFSLIKQYVKKIIVKQIKQMSEMDMHMVYLEDKIFISPMLRNEEILEEGLIHEIGHILLSKSSLQNNEDIKDEFFLKRKMSLNDILNDIEVPQRIQDLLKNSYTFSKEVDDYFNNQIGYEKLAQYIDGYFLDPYAISSYDEYLATGFQMYYSDYKDLLRQTNPLLYQEIDKVLSKIK